MNILDYIQEKHRLYTIENLEHFENRNFEVTCFDIDNNFGIVFQKCIDFSDHIYSNGDDIRKVNHLEDKRTELKHFIMDIETRVDIDYVFYIDLDDTQVFYIQELNIYTIVISEKLNYWTEALKEMKNNIFFYIGSYHWILLQFTDIHRIEIENSQYDVYIGKSICFKEVCEITCLNETLTTQGIQYFSELDTIQHLQETNKIKVVEYCYGRSEYSMHYFDRIFRKYVNSFDFLKQNTKNHTLYTSNINYKDILSVNSVAGSGKTTTLLNIAEKYNSIPYKGKSNKHTKILYLTFNKSLRDEIKVKLSNKKITNMSPYTFDSLMYHLYTFKFKKEPNIIQLKPQNISTIMPFFKGKMYSLREHYTKEFLRFCNQTEYDSITKFCIRHYGGEKRLLIELWEKAKKHEFLTFEVLRKLANTEHWCSDCIDSEFDIIMIDETQDFDKVMLDILLNDTMNMKLFVGDPLQSIYGFRGSINAFDYLPIERTMKIEFYSTFRVGDPLCSMIRNILNTNNTSKGDTTLTCTMISKSNNTTQLVYASKYENGLHEKYVYLFRSWKALLKTAVTLKNIWIHNFSLKIQQIRSLHKKMQFYTFVESDEQNFEDDLPNFLTKISTDELDVLLDSIQENMTTEKDAHIKMYTIHTFKGMEHDTIRIANDVNIEEDINIYYVAYTRALKKVIVDEDFMF